MKKQIIKKGLKQLKSVNISTVKSQAGFTITEALVIAGIVAVLSVSVAVVLDYAKVHSRDTARIANIKQIQAALELYYLYNNDYPDAVEPGGKIGAYLQYVPKNPLPNGISYKYKVCNNTIPTVCGDGFVVPVGERASYALTYRLEGENGYLGAGRHTATPAGIAGD